MGSLKMNNKIKETAIDVIDLQIKALKKLKLSINNSFEKALREIKKCKSKVLICGVGKSGIIASKISATMSSVGTPSFQISANECSHGDLGKISPADILILISNSGNTKELDDLIKFAKINKLILIGIVSNKNSNLYRSANIKLLLSEVKESGYGIVPTSSTTMQLALGDAISICLMKMKNFGKLDFKKFHPAGNLGKKLKTASDVMLTKNKIPFVNQDSKMNDAIKILNSKKLGFLVITNKNGHIAGVFTDGDLKRLIQKKKAINNLKIKKFISKNPLCVEENTLANEILIKMNKRKITSVCVYKKENKKIITGVIHIHNLVSFLKN